MTWGDSTGIVALLLNFAFYYPLVMAWLWIFAGLYYYFRWERRGAAPDNPPELEDYPPVSILLPCYNESKNLRETLSWLMRQSYPNYDVIAINDGSSDGTGEILDQLANEYEKLKVVHFTENQGKAMALRMGAMVTKNEFLVCVDGDALLHPSAVQWMMSHLLSSPRVGAVTGNPRIRNRSTMLGRMQVGEFSSIVGLIKRAQRIYGRIFTVSGVISAFRKSALHRNLYWSTDMITEDIDISWQLQLDHWDVRYEPNALCWILMPETLRGLWRQRLRWAQGGVEVLSRYLPHLLNWQQRRMWGVALEYGLSLAWAYVMLAIFLLFFIGQCIPLPESLTIDTLLPSSQGMILGITCLIQFFISLNIDRRYEKDLWKTYYWIIWYPLAFWLIGMLTTVVGAPKALLKKRGQRAVWISPDRGINDE